MDPRRQQRHNERLAETAAPRKAHVVRADVTKDADVDRTYREGLEKVGVRTRPTSEISSAAIFFRGGPEVLMKIAGLVAFSVFIGAS
jgi:hypothetical protein